MKMRYDELIIHVSSVYTLLLYNVIYTCTVLYM